MGCPLRGGVEASVASRNEAAKRMFDRSASSLALAISHRSNSSGFAFPKLPDQQRPKMHLPHPGPCSFQPHSLPFECFANVTALAMKTDQAMASDQPGLPTRGVAPGLGFLGHGTAAAAVQLSRHPHVQSLVRTVLVVVLPPFFAATFLRA